MHCIQGAPARPGPEATLVANFVQTDLPPSRGKERRFTFIEPHVELARPDIVVVYWDSTIAETWPTERQMLTGMDLRLAHFLFLSGPIPESDIQAVFPHRPARLLERLDRAGIASRSGTQWHVNNMDDIFAVRRIVAFEAKVSALSQALMQALRNTWFASESYILTTSEHPNTRIIQQARSWGVGLVVRRHDSPLRQLVQAKPHKVPQSYASWLFNELTWKTSLGATTHVC